MASGYNILIDVQKLSPLATTDALGPAEITDDTNWTTHHQPRAKIMATGGREIESLGQIRDETTHVFEVRRSSETEAITPSMRMQLNGVKYDIVAAYIPEFRGRRVIIEAIRNEP